MDSMISYQALAEMLCVTLATVYTVSGSESS